MFACTGAKRPWCVPASERCSRPAPRRLRVSAVCSHREDASDGCAARGAASSTSSSSTAGPPAAAAATAGERQLCQPLPPLTATPAAGPAPGSSRPLSRRQLAAAALSATAAAAVTAAPGPALAAAAAEAPAAAPAGGGEAARKQSREVKMVMRVTASRGSVPQQWVADFQTALEGYGVVALTQRAQLADIYAELAGNKSTKGKPTTVDAVTLGDTWLQRAITSGLIQPIPNARQYRWWSRLSPRWQQLVCRSAATGAVDPRGEVWAAPYRWGAVLIAYRQDRLARNGLPEGIRDWSDLLAPQLKGRVAFMDSPRDVVGAALKTLGQGYNSTSADLLRCGLTEEDLRTRVQRLVGQVRVFSNSDHLRALSAGEVDAVVGWSDDLLPLVMRTNNLSVAAPLSGTSLFADCWCTPAAAAGGAEDGEASPLLPAWLELGLQPVHAQRSKGLRGGASPLLLPGSSRGGSRSKRQPACSLLEPSEPPAGSSELEQLLPSTEVLERSEFLEPLPPDTAALYRRLLLP